MAVRQRIFQIHIFAHECIKFLDLWKAFDMKVVDFFYKLFFKLLKLPAIAEQFVFLPIIQRRKQFLHVRSRLRLRKIFFYHMSHANVN